MRIIEVVTGPLGPKGDTGPIGPAGPAGIFTEVTTNVYSTTSSLQITGSLTVTQGITGSLSGTSSFAISSSWSPSAFPFTGSAVITGSLSLTGHAQSNVTALTISSNTASLDLNMGNFFTLQLVAGTNTFINPINIKAGQSVLLEVATIGSATVSFPSSIKQPSGSTYVPTTTTGIDILTFAAFNINTLHLVTVKNLI